MAKIELYTSPYCGYCYLAKHLLDRKGAVYTEIDILADADRRTEMVERSGGNRTVPQIFIDDRHIGGSDELVALDRNGALDVMLTGATEG